MTRPHARPRKRPALHLPGGVAVAFAMILVGCGDDAPASTAPSDLPTVLATTGIWADVVANVACDGSVSVESVIPPGGDPHSFEPSLADREELDAASLVVANGAGLEEGLEDTLGSVESDGTPVFRVAEQLIQGDDPHVWFDPVLVAAALPDLASTLTDEAGLDEGTIEGCVADYERQLEAIHAEIESIVATVPAESRLLVTNHDSLGYFAGRYGFEVIGTVIPTPSGLGETNPAALEELADLIEQTGVGAIFAETQHSTEDARALADRVGDVEVVTLETGTLGQPGTDSDTYLGFLRSNAEAIAAALS